MIPSQSLRARAARLASFALFGLVSLAAGAFSACEAAVAPSLTPGDDAGDDGAPTTDGAAPDAPTGPPTTDLLVLALGDLRGQLDPVVELDSHGLPQSYGGLEALATYLARERADAGAAVLLSAGDAFGASPILSAGYDDEPTARGLSLLGLTAHTLGAHDFARGTATLSRLLGLGSFRAVFTNLANVNEDLGPRPVTPFLLVDAVAAPGARPMRVAILGLTEPDLAQREPASRLGSIAIRDPGLAADQAARANQAAQDARLVGADVVIAVAHMGVDGIASSGIPAGPLVELAKRLQGIDLLVGGATDIAFATRVADADGGGLAILQNRIRGRTFARARLHVESGLVTVTETTIVDPVAVQVAAPACDGGLDAGACACAQGACSGGFTCSDASLSLCERRAVPLDLDASLLLAPYRDAMGGVLEQTIATLDGGLAEDGAELVLETALGDLVADALLDAYRGSPASAQIALVPGSRLRASLPSSYVPASVAVRRDAAPFDLVLADPLRVLPSGDTAVVRKLTGQALWHVLEEALAHAPAPSGAFLQVGGIAVTYSAGADAGARVRTVTLLDGAKDIPVWDFAEYVVVMPDSTSRGQDGHMSLVEDVPTLGRELLSDALTAYLRTTATVGVPGSLARIKALP